MSKDRAEREAESDRKHEAARQAHYAEVEAWRANHYEMIMRLDALGIDMRELKDALDSMPDERY